jgi:hypothetical protein
MSTKYPGGFITKSPVAPSLAAASGIWSLDQAEQNIKANTWPLAPTLLTRSLRFRQSASAYLNRTPATTTNQKTWTWSGWVKLGSLSSTPVLLCQYTDGVNQTQIQLRAGGGGNDYQIRFYDYTASTFTSNVYWSPLYRDPSSWYHIVFVADTTQATDTNRLKLYVNGVQVTSTTSATWPAQNTDLRINLAAPHFINANGAGVTYEGYLAEVNFIDGQALTPSYFGAYDGTTGVWQPAHYNGTYGTNGFYLPFTNTTSTTTLGYDSSGNGNNWTTNNISLTTGVTYDSMTDVPTLTSATAANFAVLNPLDKVGSGALTGGNLDYTTSSGTYDPLRGTVGISSGKWYWEVTCTATSGASQNTFAIGLASQSTNINAANWYVGADAASYCYYGVSGDKYNNNSSTAYGASYTTGDVIGVALDMDAGTLVFYKNNTSQGTAFSSLVGTFMPAFSDGATSGTTSVAFNFGQRPFSYTPPSGFVALNTYNLPASSIPNGAAYMAATTYTGNGGTLAVANTVGSTSFQPDFVWVKNRTNANNHILADSVRGTGLYLASSNTDAEQSAANSITAFNSNGFSIGSISGGNANGSAVVGWQWKGGGTAVSNTNGSITSSVSANTTSGCSVVTYTGTGATGTVGHGLNVAPSMVIVKDRTSVSNWYVWHQALTASQFLILNSTAATGTSSTIWNNLLPTSTVFGSDNWGSDNIVAYCFAAIKGFSAFGSYTGNGSTDGPFVYTGFRPRYVMIKRTDSGSSESWFVLDTARSPYNVPTAWLAPNLSNAEGTDIFFDILSNGFKFRATISNGSGQTFIYAAFAENPFQNALAR